MISEPITTATDYLLGACALTGAILLWRSALADGSASRRAWAGAFAAVAAAAWLGGTWHGFSPRMSPASASILWKATLAAGGLASFFLLTGAAGASLPVATARRVRGAAAVKLALFLGWSAVSEGFEPVVVDSGLGLLAVLAIQVVDWKRRRAASVPWVASGVLVSLAAGAIEASRTAAGPLSADDVYHLTMIAALVLLYRGGRLLAVD